MASDDERDPGPDLELPSLFGRRRRKQPAAPEQTAAAAAPAPPAAQQEPTEELPVTSRPVGAGGPDVADEPTQPLRPVAGATRRPPTAPPRRPPTAPPAPAPAPAPAAATTSVPDEVAQQPPRQAEPEPGPEPTAPVRPAEPTADAAPTRPPRPTTPPPPRRRGPDMTWAPDPKAPATAVSAPAAVAVAEPLEPAVEPPVEPAARERRSRRPSLPKVDLTAPQLPARAAAAVAGVAVALTGIALVWLSLQACTSVRGVSSCGGVGLLAIVLTLVAQVAVGVIVLGVLGHAGQRSLAVLGVGITSFVAMLLLYASVSGVGLSIALLLVTPAAYVVAEGITSGRFADPPEQPR